MLKKKKEKNRGFVDIDENDCPELIPGDELLCIKDVIMDVDGEIAYTKGKVYFCEEKNCITDNGGDVHHGTESDFLSEFFKIKKNIDNLK